MLTVSLSKPRKVLQSTVERSHFSAAAGAVKAKVAATATRAMRRNGMERPFDLLGARMSDDRHRKVNRHRSSVVAPASPGQKQTPAEAGVCHLLACTVKSVMTF